MGGGCARVLRGASWNNDNPDNLRSSNRNNDHPGNRNNNYGFRVVWVGASARKVLSRNGRKMGEVRRGETPCAASAKKPPNRPIHAPLGEKTRRGPWPVGACAESHGLHFRHRS